MVGSLHPSSDDIFGYCSPFSSSEIDSKSVVLVGIFYRDFMVLVDWIELQPLSYAMGYPLGHTPYSTRVWSTLFSHCTSSTQSDSQASHLYLSPHTLSHTTTNQEYGASRVELYSPLWI